MMYDFLNKPLHENDIIITKYNSPNKPYIISKILYFTDKMVVSMICKTYDDIFNDDGQLIRNYSSNCILIPLMDAVHILTKENT